MSAKILHIVIASALVWSLAASPSLTATRTGKVHLGFTGDTLEISSDVASFDTWLEHRRLTLIQPNGKRRTMILDDASPKLGNQSLNLYHTRQDTFDFILVGETDCVEIDTVRAELRRCAFHARCEFPPPSAEYIGRFDWMNGHNPPHGTFVFDFRFLPSYDAAEGRSCS